MPISSVAGPEPEKLARLIEAVCRGSNDKLEMFLERNARQLSLLEVKCLQAMHLATHLEEGRRDPKDVFFTWIVQIADVDASRLSNRERFLFDAADSAMEKLYVS